MTTPSQPGADVEPTQIEAAPAIGSDPYYRLLCETLGVALIATDRDLKIRIWNAAAARTFGAAADRMIGAPVTSVVPQERRGVAERMFRRAIETGETIQLEFQHRDGRGQQRELAATIAAVVSDGGERIGASVCVRDITRRMAMQGELLENRKMVALGEMAGAIAHHFNNILGGMVMSIDYARSSPDAGVQSRVLEQVTEALQRATSLVDGLLAFAEGDRRHDDVAELTDIIQETAKAIEARVAGTGIRFELRSSAPEAMPFPRSPLRTVLNNITDNAIEAMPEGGTLVLDVSVREQDVVILVEDTGVGLDEAAKSRIFEPFWSTKGVLATATGQATGLGLAIAHGLISMLDGTITVVSAPGRGSCFRITLPRPNAA